MNKTRLRLRFFGSVQGVGFRYRMYHTAMSLGITGWVRNCFDGSVQAELQGDREAIDECIGRVAAGNFVEITDIKSEKIPVIEDDRRFSIRD